MYSLPVIPSAARNLLTTTWPRSVCTTGLTAKRPHLPIQARLSPPASFFEGGRRSLTKGVIPPLRPRCFLRFPTRQVLFLFIIPLRVASRFSTRQVLSPFIIPRGLSPPDRSYVVRPRMLSPAICLTSLSFRAGRGISLQPLSPRLHDRPHGKASSPPHPGHPLPTCLPL